MQQMICIRSLLAVQKVIINDKHSFELYVHATCGNAMCA